MTPETRHLRHAPLALAVLALSGHAAALAPTAQAQSEPLQVDEWLVRLGAGVVIGPAFPGSKTIRVMPVPMGEVAYRPGLPLLDTVFLNARDGLGAIAYREGPFSVGGAIGFAPGRDEDVSARLEGMGDIDPAARLNLFVRADFGQFGLSFQANRALGDQEGTTLTFGASVRQPIDSSFMLMARVDATWADRDSMQQWFGVTAQQSRRSRLAAYDAGAGMRSVSATLAGTYSITDHWSLNASVGVSQLLGDAADSPVTERTTQPFSLLSVTYRF